MNRRLDAVTLPEDFATVFQARWDPATSRLHYASAGHEPALIVPADGPARTLGSTGTLLGINRDSTWETGGLSITRDDLLACWTDGLNEARDAAGRLFGRERIVALVEDNRGAAPGEIVQRVQAAVLISTDGGTVVDDCTLLAVRFAGPGVC